MSKPKKYSKWAKPKQQRTAPLNPGRPYPSTQPIGPGNRLYETNVINQAGGRPPTRPRTYESDLIPTPYRRNPRLYETGPNGAAALYGQPNRLYESDIIAANTESPYEAAARARAGQGRGAYGPILAQNEPGTPGADPNNPGGSGSGGSGNPWGGDIAEGSVETPVDPVVAEQQAFLARLLALKNETIAGYGPASNNIGQIYDLASKDLADPYNDYMNRYREGATSLGVGQGFSQDDNVKLADLAARKLQENYDTNEATDLATIEKMKSLNTDSFTQMMLAAEAGLLGPQAIANALALEAAGSSGGGGGGGGGGGRGGGGSSGGSSGPWSEKATQQEDFFNPGLATAIGAIQDPFERAMADQFYSEAGGKVPGALSRSATALATANAYRPPPVTARRRSAFGAPYLMQKVRSQVGKVQNERDKKAIANVMKFMQDWSAGYNPQITSNKVTSTGTTKYK